MTFLLYDILVVKLFSAVIVILSRGLVVQRTVKIILSATAVLVDVCASHFLDYLWLLPFVSVQVCM